MYTCVWNVYTKYTGVYVVRIPVLHTLAKEAYWSIFLIPLATLHIWIILRHGVIVHDKRPND